MKRDNTIPEIDHTKNLLDSIAVLCTRVALHRDMTKQQRHRLLDWFKRLRFLAENAIQYLEALDVISWAEVYAEEAHNTEEEFKRAYEKVGKKKKEKK